MLSMSCKKAAKIEGASERIMAHKDARLQLMGELLHQHPSSHIISMGVAVHQEGELLCMLPNTHYSD